MLTVVSPGAGPGRRPETGSPIRWTLPIRAVSPCRSASWAGIVGTLLSSERGAERSFHELFVRSETGLGAEKALPGH